MDVKGQLRRAQAENLAADPSSGADRPDGRLWLNTADDKLKYCEDDTVRTVANTDEAQTLTNKTIDADANTITNIENADIKAAAAIAHSKMAALTASRAMVTDGSGVAAASAVTSTELGYVAGATSAIQTQIDNHLADTTTHGTTGAIVGTTDTQTLTNKTLAFLRQSVATDNTTTGAAAELDSVATGVVRLTNASLESINSMPAGVSGQTIILENRTDATINILNDSTSPNQIITGTGGDVEMPAFATFMFTYDATDSVWYLTGGSGSGSGSSGINYIESSNATQGGATGWSTYADAAGTSPVDGTGGTPNVTFAAGGSSALRGTDIFALSKDAVNRQGEGVSYDFTIDAADKAKILQVSFDYVFNNTDFVAGSSSTDSDITVWIYDVTNSRLIQPSTYKLFSNSATIADRFIANFQTSADSTSYRLIFHIGGTNANDWIFRFDNVVVAPTTIAFGTPITDWKDAGVMTIGAVTSAPTKGTTSTDRILWRRLGDSAQFRYEYKQTGAGAGAGSGDYLYTLPAGLSFDSSKVNFITAAITTVDSADVARSQYGTTKVVESGGASGASGGIIPYDATRFRVMLENAYTSIEPQDSAFFDLTNAALEFCFEFQVPIAGWSSQVQMSDVSDQRIVAARYDMVAGATSTANNPLNFATKVFDTHNTVTTGVDAWKFTAPIPGVYEISAAFYLGANIERITVYKNGAVNCYLGHHNSGLPLSASAVVQLNAGDYIDIRSDSATTSATTSAGHDGFVAVKRMANPSLISATETIGLVVIDSTTAATTAAPFLYTSVQRDTHSAYSAATGKFTAPSAGLYCIKASVGGSLGAIGIDIYKNGVKIIEGIRSGSITNYNVAADWPLVAGDTIEIRPSGNATADGDDTSNYLMIHRIGL